MQRGQRGVEVVGEDVVLSLGNDADELALPKALKTLLIDEGAMRPSVSRGTIPVRVGSSRVTGIRIMKCTGVGDGWFETMDVPIVAGTAPSTTDPEGVVLSQRLAQIVFPGEEAIGQRLERGYRVVGIARDVQMRSLRTEGNPAVWYPAESHFNARVAVSVSMRPGAQGEGSQTVEAALSVVDPDRSVAVVEMRSAVLDGVQDARRLGVILGLIALLALMLKAAGIFGVASQRAAERRQEFGIRLTLGAEPASLPRLLLSGWAALCLVGLTLGGLGAVVVGRALGGILYRTAPYDPGALGLASILLATVALGATWWLAARAARVDAVETLRESG